MTIATGAPGSRPPLDHAFDGNAAFGQMPGDLGQHAGHSSTSKRRYQGDERRIGRRGLASAASAWAGRPNTGLGSRARSRPDRRPRPRRSAPRPRRGRKRRTVPPRPHRPTRHWRRHRHWRAASVPAPWRDALSASMPPGVRRATPSSLMRKPNSRGEADIGGRDVLDAFHRHARRGRARSRRPGRTAAPACARCRRRPRPGWDRLRHSQAPAPRPAPRRSWRPVGFHLGEDVVAGAVEDALDRLHVIGHQALAQRLDDGHAARHRRLEFQLQAFFARPVAASSRAMLGQQRLVGGHHMLAVLERGFDQLAGRRPRRRRSARPPHRRRDLARASGSAVKLLDCRSRAPFCASRALTAPRQSRARPRAGQVRRSARPAP